jgi:hypothetical protein
MSPSASTPSPPLGGMLVINCCALLIKEILARWQTAAQTSTNIVDVGAEEEEDEASIFYPDAVDSVMWVDGPLYRVSTEPESAVSMRATIARKAAV